MIDTSRWRYYPHGGEWCTYPETSCYHQEFCWFSSWLKNGPVVQSSDYTFVNFLLLTCFNCPLRFQWKVVLLCPQLSHLQMPHGFFNQLFFQWHTRGNTPVVGPGLLSYAQVSSPVYLIPEIYAACILALYFPTKNQEIPKSLVIVHGNLIV